MVLEPHAKRRRGEPASVADEMLDEEDDDDGLELGETVVGVAEDDAVDDTSRQVLFTQQMLLTQMERQAACQKHEVEAWRRAEDKDAFLWCGRAGSYVPLRTQVSVGSSNSVLQSPFRCNFDDQAQNVGPSEVGANSVRPYSRKSAKEL